jgi:thiol-disulfide isomerase/thioredoxin
VKVSEVANTPTGEATRRGWLVGAIAGAAAVAGAGFAWWRHRAEAVDPAVAARLWALELQTPQGGALSFAALRGRPLLVNFWATWCPPCVEEMPLLDRFYRQQAAKGWHVVGLAVDQPGAVRTFLRKTPVTFPIGLAGLEAIELTKALGNSAGGLPFSVVLGADGAVRERRIGRVSEADLQAWAAAS